jgi:hypothetical protein
MLLNLQRAGSCACDSFAYHRQNLRYRCLMMRTTVINDVHMAMRERPALSAMEESAWRTVPLRIPTLSSNAAARFSHARDDLGRGVFSETAIRVVFDFGYCCQVLDVPSFALPLHAVHAECHSSNSEQAHSSNRTFSFYSQLTQLLETGWGRLSSGCLLVGWVLGWLLLDWLLLVWLLLG